MPYMETLAKDPPRKIKDIFWASVSLIGRRQGKVERAAPRTSTAPSCEGTKKEGGTLRCASYQTRLGISLVSLEYVPGVKSIYQGKDESFPENAQNGEQESN